MAKWELKPGVRESTTSDPGGFGWAYTIEREGERRTIRADLSGTAASFPNDVPQDARDAWGEEGIGAVMAVLDRDNPPARLVLTTKGIVERQGSPVE